MRENQLKYAKVDFFLRFFFLFYWRAGSTWMTLFFTVPRKLLSIQGLYWLLLYICLSLLVIEFNIFTILLVVYFSILVLERSNLQTCLHQLLWNNPDLLVVPLAKYLENKCRDQIPRDQYDLENKFSYSFLPRKLRSSIFSRA